MTRHRFAPLALLFLLVWPASAQDFLVPMDARQTNHLKAYGVAYWLLGRGYDLDWLLNYRGGSFLMPGTSELESELRVRGIYYERLERERDGADHC